MVKLLNFNSCFLDHILSSYNDSDIGEHYQDRIEYKCLHSMSKLYQIYKCSQKNTKHIKKKSFLDQR